MSSRFALLAVLLLAGCAHDSLPPVGERDSTAPAAVRDLHAAAIDSVSVRLDWTAPGDDGAMGAASRYAVRWADTDTNSWEAMTELAGVPVPRSAGSRETLLVRDRYPGTTYRFILRAFDEANNESPPSDTAQARTPGGDRTPPSAVTDLAAVRVTETSVTLRWTAPGDDGQLGTATRYDLRYATFYVDENYGWDQATIVAGVPAPSAAGAVQEFTITGLRTQFPCYVFALRTVDDAGLVSPVSNRAKAGTPGPEDTHWWDGFAPAPAGQGLDGDVYTLFVHDGELIAGGSFHRAGTVLAENVAAWNGSSWRSLGGGLDGPVRALCEYQGDLVAGGSFSASGGDSPSVVCWRDGRWETLGPGPAWGVDALAVWGGALYATESSGRILGWDGGVWTQLPTPPVDPPLTWGVSQGRLYLGGCPGQYGADSLCYMVRYLGSGWGPVCVTGMAVPLPGAELPCVRAMRDDGERLLIGASEDAGACFRAVALYDGEVFRSLDPPFRYPNPITDNGPSVNALAIWRDRQVVAGWFFTGTQDEPSTSVLCLDGDTWRPLASGIGRSEPEFDYTGLYGVVHALAEYQGSLYAGGSFQWAGARPSSGIARWDE